VDFHGEKRSRDTHESKTDPDAYLFKKSTGSESKLAYLVHLLMENRHGLVIDVKVTQATGTAEQEAAIELVDALAGSQRITLGAVKNYDTRGFVVDMREMTVTLPKMAPTAHRPSMGAPPAIPVTPPARRFASGSRNTLAGQDHWWFAQEPVHRPREA
jgi:hypothetical protein